MQQIHEDTTPTTDETHTDQPQQSPAEQGSGSVWRRAVQGNWWVVLVFVVSLLVHTHILVGVSIFGLQHFDGFYYYAYIPSLLSDRDLEFTNDYETSLRDGSRIDNSNYLGIRTVTDHAINVFPIGSALLRLPFAVPAYWVSAAVEGDSPDWMGYYQYSVVLVSNWASVFYANLTMFLIYRILRRYLSRSAALLIALSLIWLTVAQIYVTDLPGFAHIPDLFCMTLLLWLAWRWSLKWNPIWLPLIGLTAGLCVSIRPQNGLSVAILGAFYGVMWLRLQRPSVLVIVRSALIVAVTGFITTAPHLIVNLTLYGKLLEVPQNYLPYWDGEPFIQLDRAAILPGLFGTRNGLFPYNPFLLVCAFAALVTLLPRRFRLPPRLVWLAFVPLLLIFALQAWLNLSAGDWWGGIGPGQRRLIPTFAVFTFALALGWLVIRRWRPPVRQIIMGAVWVIALLALWFNHQLVAMTMKDWITFRASMLDRELTRDLGVYVTDLVDEHFQYRRQCQPYDEVIPVPADRIQHGNFDEWTLRDDGSILARGRGTLWVNFRAALNRPYHFGFRVQTPYRYDSTITVRMFRTDTGEPVELDRYQYFNEHNGYIGITVENHQDSDETTWRGLAFFGPREDDMPIIISDMQVCGVSIGFDPYAEEG